MTRNPGYWSRFCTSFHKVPCSSMKPMRVVFVEYCASNAIGHIFRRGLLFSLSLLEVIAGQHGIRTHSTFSRFCKFFSLFLSTLGVVFDRNREYFSCWSLNSWIADRRDSVKAVPFSSSPDFIESSRAYTWSW